MAIGVDTSKYKPRRFKGTPTHIVRNRISLAVLAFSTLIGVGFHYSNITLPLRKATEVFLTDPIEEVERRQLIASPLRKRTGDQFRKMMEEERNPAQPHI